MAPAGKLTTLELFNEIWTNMGEIKLADLTGVAADPDQQKLFDDMNAYSLELAQLYPWKLLKPQAKSSMTLADGINYYTPATGMYNFDPNSFRFDTTQVVEYVEESDWDEVVSDPTLTGTPIYIKYDGTYFYIYKVPTSGEVGKTITYTAYILPALLTLAAPTATSWVPAPFDRMVLVKWITYKRLRARLDQEAAAYHGELYGGTIGRRKVAGSLLEMKKAYADVFKTAVETVNARYPRGIVMGNADYGRANR
jgi:hypothetical protein